MAKDNYHHNYLKTDLIEKGIKLLDEVGYDGFSLRKVAKACNVSHTAPYRHFKNKDELILAISDEVMNKFSRCLQDAVDKHPDNPRSQLREMGCAYVDFFVRNPEYLRLLFLSDIKNRINPNSCPDSNSVHQETNHSSFNILLQTVERYQKAIQEKIGLSTDFSAIVLGSWGMVHGISILLARKEFPYQGDSMELVRKVFWSEMFPW